MLLVAMKCSVCKEFSCAWQRIRRQRNDSYDFVIKTEILGFDDLDILGNLGEPALLKLMNRKNL